MSTSVVMRRPSFWFNNVYLKTLRDYRIAIFGWGIGMGLLVYSTLSIFPSLGLTKANSVEINQLIKSFAWLSEGIKLYTAGGYLTYKVGFTILVMAIWPLLAGARMLRGEEERGSMDALLSLPETRAKVAIQKVLAMWTALLGMGLLIGLFAYAGGVSVKADYGFGDSLLYGLNLTLICAVFGSIALFISQFTEDRGAAAGITGGLLVLFIVMDMVHRVIAGPGAEFISRLSPVYYYNLSKPVITSYGANPGALLVLFALTVLLAGAAIWLFVGRDIGAAVAWLRLPERQISPANALPVNDWSLRSIYARSLRKILVPTFWWALGFVAFSAWMVVIVKQIEAGLAEFAKGSPFLQGFVSSLGGSNEITNATFLSAIFSFLPLLLMAYAVTQASAWSSDADNGRYELVLAAPQSRLTLILARFAALATGTVVISLLTLASIEISSVANGIKLDGGNLAAATLTLIPLALLMAALGYLFSGWVVTAVDTGLLSFLLLVWYFVNYIGPDLKWPEWTQRLSAFYYYGNPLLKGLPLGSMLLVIGVGAVALILASARFMRKDMLN
jgi:ABC-2 type transport system permease protein